MVKHTTSLPFTPSVRAFGEQLMQCSSEHLVTKFEELVDGIPSAELNKRLNEKRQTLLMLCASQGFHEGVSRLLDLGACANMVDEDNRTALSYFAEMPHIPTFERLWKATKAELRVARDSEGNDVTHYLAAQKSLLLFASEMSLVGRDGEFVLEQRYGTTFIDDTVGQGVSKLRVIDGKLGIAVRSARVSVRYRGHIVLSNAAPTAFGGCPLPADVPSYCPEGDSLEAKARLLGKIVSSTCDGPQSLVSRNFKGDTFLNLLERREGVSSPNVSSLARFLDTMSASSLQFLLGGSLRSLVLTVVKGQGQYYAGVTVAGAPWMAPHFSSIPLDQGPGLVDQHIVPHILNCYFADADRFTAAVVAEAFQAAFFEVEDWKNWGAVLR